MEFVRKDLRFVLGASQIGNSGIPSGDGPPERNIEARFGELCSSPALPAEEIKRLCQRGRETKHGGKAD